MDPNPENFVGAGIIQTKALQVGCLLRLEPNAQAQVSGGSQGRLLCVHSLPFRSLFLPAFCLSISFTAFVTSLLPFILSLYHLSDRLIPSLIIYLPCI